MNKTPSQSIIAPKRKNSPINPPSTQTESLSWPLASISVIVCENVSGVTVFALKKFSTKDALKSASFLAALSFFLYSNLSRLPFNFTAASLSSSSTMAYYLSFSFWWYMWEKNLKALIEKNHIVRIFFFFFLHLDSVFI